MTREERERLRALSGSLRMKSLTGQVATAAVRDLLHLVPQALERGVEEDITSGALKQRWEAALEAARAAGVSPDETQLAALLSVLAWTRAVGKRTIQAYLENAEAQRRQLEARAEEAEAALRVDAREHSPGGNGVTSESQGAEGLQLIEPRQESTHG